MTHATTPQHRMDCSIDGCATDCPAGPEPARRESIIVGWTGNYDGEGKAHAIRSAGGIAFCGQRVRVGSRTWDGMPKGSNGQAGDFRCARCHAAVERQFASTTREL